MAIGTHYKGIHAGLSGDVGCFSFYPVKHITTGEGGMFVTRHKALAIVGTTGIILAALYVLLLYQRTMQGPLNEKIRVAASFKDLKAREIAAVSPLIALILVLGIYPKPVIDIINPSIKATMHDVGQTDPQPLTAAVNGGHK